MNFQLTVDCQKRAGKVIAITRETGIITVGSSETEARQKADHWNAFILAEARANGEEFFQGFLGIRGIVHP